MKRILLIISSLAFLLTGTFLSAQTGSTCDDPIILSTFPTQDIVDLTGNTLLFGDDYSVSPCNTQFIAGDDVVYEFTITEAGVLNGDIAGPTASMHITQGCIDTASTCIDIANGLTGGSLNGVMLQPGTYMATVSCRAGEQTIDYTMNLSFSEPNDSADILSFSFPEQTGPAIIDPVAHTVDIEVAMGTNPANLVSSFILSSGANSAINMVPQISGITANDFTSPVIYRVYPETIVDSVDWTVSVSVALTQSSENDFLTYSFAEQTGPAVINNVSHTIDIEVLAGTNVTNLIATFTSSALSNVLVGTTAQISGITPNDFSTPVPYTVRAEDLTDQAWTVTVSVAAPPQGSTCADPIVLSTFPATPVTDLADNSTLYYDDYSASSCNMMFIGGNDVVYEFTLTEDGYLAGSISGNRSAVHIVDACPDGTETCIAYAGGMTGGSFQDQAIATGTYFAVVSSQATAQTIDYTLNLDFRAPYDSAFIEAFSFPEQTGAATINPTNKTVDIEVAMGTNIASLVASFDLSVNAIAKVNQVNQVSSVTANDFTNPVTYWIIPENVVDSVAWTITTTVATSQSSENNILTFSFPEQTAPADINATNHTVDINVAFGTDVTTLVADFTSSILSIVEIGAVDQTSGVTANDFTNPVVYTVTAEDATAQDWTVTVTVEPKPLGFDCTDPIVLGSFPATAVADSGNTTEFGDIYSTSTCNNNFIEGNEVVYEFTLTEDGSLSGTITGTGAAIHILDACPNGTETCIAFANENSSGAFNDSPITAGTYLAIISSRFIQQTVDYNFSLFFESNATEILDFSIPQETTTSTIDNVGFTIDVEVAYGTDITKLVPTFTLSDGAEAYIGVDLQESGVTSVDFSSPVNYRILAADGSTQQLWTVTVSTAQNDAAEILTYGFAEETGPAVINSTGSTIDIEVAFGTDPANLIANFTLSDAATAQIGAILQTSGASSNNFTSPVVYTITAEDGTIKDWTVTVTVAAAPSSENDFLSYSFTEQTGPSIINALSHTIDIEVAFGTNPSNLIATFTSSPRSAVEISSTAQVSGITSNDFTSTVVYTIIAEDATPQDWTVTVTVAVAQSSDNDILTFSFLEESSPALINYTNHSISIEVVNGTILNNLVASFTISPLASIRIGGSTQISGVTPNNFNSPVIYTVEAEDGTTQDWTVIVTETVVLSSEKEILSFSMSEQTGPATINSVSATIDIEVALGTDITSLVANFTISALSNVAIASVSQISGVTVNDFSSPLVYRVTAEDGSIKDWTVTVSIASTQSSENDIIEFSFAEQTGTATINAVSHTIDIEVALGTDVTNLVANFTLSTLASANVGAAPQISGITSNDFTNSVSYVVTAEDGTPQTWDITVTVATSLSDLKEILSFSFPQQISTATINSGTATININVALGTDINNLIATFTISTLASIDIGGLIQTSGISVNDFSSPLTYTVKAEDGSTKDWIINVTEASSLSSENDFVSFYMVEQTGAAVINNVAHTVTINVAQGTDVTNLVATFGISALASIDIAGTPQVSGITSNNYSSAVTYTITAEDGSTQDWTVTVSITSNIQELSSIKLKIYPVPASSTLNIVASDINSNIVNMTMIDASGKIVVLNSMKVFNNEITTSIDVSSYTSGLYYIRLITEDKVITKGLIIE